ncbi:hypothetical protein BU16DRAFT_529273 [Lophium mytilinum]|uniref:Uncharacterized protein n=1 Tax=Lophium mytilinum TaxID=390894 RepID=A0A6A6QLV2_9PEZI|nr:hypothetical protein BU16DRAFT_529273 [Lophium mytilinum]
MNASPSRSQLSMMSASLDKTGAAHPRNLTTAVKEAHGLGIAGAAPDHSQEPMDESSSSDDLGARAGAEYPGQAAVSHRSARGGPAAAHDSRSRMDNIHHGRSHHSRPRNVAIKQELLEDMPFTIQRVYGPPIPHPMPDPATLNQRDGNGTKHKLSDEVQGNEITDATDRRRIRRKLSDEDRSVNDARMQSFVALSAPSFQPPSSAPERRTPVHPQGSFDDGRVPSSSAPDGRPTLTPTLTPGSSFNNGTHASPRLRTPHDTPPTSQVSRDWGRILNVPRFEHLNTEQRRAERQRAALRLQYVQAQREALEVAVKLKITEADELREQLIMLNITTGSSAVTYAADC